MVKQKTKYTYSLIISIAIIIISNILYFQKNPYWYYPAVLGVFLLFDYLSYLRKNKTTLSILFSKKYKLFFRLYLYLFILGLLIELIGRFLLNLWHYPLVNPIIKNTLGFIFYPFILMSFKEMYFFLKSFFKRKTITTISAMILGIIIWEIPNVFSKDWIYTIPIIKQEILGINIIVIIGWVILIQGPIIIYKWINKK